MTNVKKKCSSDHDRMMFCRRRHRPSLVIIVAVLPPPRSQRRSSTNRTFPLPACLFIMMMLVVAFVPPSTSRLNPPPHLINQHYWNWRWQRGMDQLRRRINIPPDCCYRCMTRTTLLSFIVRQHHHLHYHHQQQLDHRSIRPSSYRKHTRIFLPSSQHHDRRTIQHLSTKSSSSSSFSSLSNISSTNTSNRNDDTDNADEEEDTIFALSSGGGGASTSLAGGATAVAVIRISGPCAFDALRELLSPFPLNSRENTTPTTVQIPKLPKARNASLRTLYDPVSDSSYYKGKEAEEEDGENNYAESNERAQRKSRYRRRDPLDSALVLTFPGPNSFTGQDIVELHCHGSRGVVKGVLDALSSLHSRKIIISNSSTATTSGRRVMRLRPADPGEFTKRAYAHGKLGLMEVEALSDLIVADTSKQRKQALQQFDGRLSRLYQGWRSELVKGLAHAEAVIDFGDDESLSFDDDNNEDDEDDDDDDVTKIKVVDDGGMSIWGTIRPRITALREAMDRHLADASRGELLRDGLRIAIVGRPNAGKSSLLNLLAGRDAAIVSSTPGTTRDVVEVILDLSGVRCTLLDTAGVREATEGGVNDIEVEGMRRARVAARDAHIIVGVVDASDYERGFDAVNELIDSSSSELEGEGEEEDVDNNVMASKNVLYVVNKIDLMEDTGELSRMPISFGISCATSEGVENFLCSLSEKALSMVSNDDDNGSGRTKSAILSVEGTEGAVITRARHRRHVKAASEALARFEHLSDQGYMALDLAAEELRLAASELGRVTGAIDVENILDVLFADFCIGK